MSANSSNFGIKRFAISSKKIGKKRDYWACRTSVYSSSPAISFCSFCRSTM